jgi:hypothetical protein
MASGDQGGVLDPMRRLLTGRLCTSHHADMRSPVPAAAQAAAILPGIQVGSSVAPPMHSSPILMFGSKRCDNAGTTVDYRLSCSLRVAGRC